MSHGMEGRSENRVAGQLLWIPFVRVNQSSLRVAQPDFIDETKTGNTAVAFPMRGCPKSSISAPFDGVL